MDQQTFETFRDMIYRTSGIVLADEKKALLEARIRKRLSRLKLHDETEYLRIIELDASGEELVNLIDVVSTNVTSFYREPAHFAHYRETLKKWSAARRGPVRVWCAAASSGEEPYTLAIEACLAAGRRPDGFKLLATDICTPVLQRAVQGYYRPAEVAKMPPDIRQRYFTHTRTASAELYQVVPEVAGLVTFKRLNLVEFPYPLNGPIDIIFCRNVMIYFDTPTRQKIVREFERLLAHDGYLYLSHSENLLAVNHSLEKAGPSIFHKK